MRVYDILVGEFHVYYAGFFDPGFGYADSGGKGSRAVLEVPEKIYGTGIGSSHQRQTLALAKQFNPLGSNSRPQEAPSSSGAALSTMSRRVTMPTGARSDPTTMARDGPNSTSMRTAYLMFISVGTVSTGLDMTS